MCTRDNCQNRQKNTDIGAAKVGPAMAGPAGPVSPPLSLVPYHPYPFHFFAMSSTTTAFYVLFHVAAVMAEWLRRWT